MWGAAALLLISAGPALSSTTTDCTKAQPVVSVVRTVAVDGYAPVVSSVALPDTLTRQLLSDAAHLSYQVALSPCRGDALALHIFRAGAPYVVTTADGVQLKSLIDADHEGAQYNGRVPALFAVPAGVQTVNVVFQTKSHLFLGLFNVSLGPVAVMLPLEAQAISAVVGFGRTSAGVLFVLGLLGGFLWLQQRARASLFWLSLGCVLWGVRGHIYFASDLPLPARWFELLNPLLVLCTAVCVALTCLCMVAVPARNAARFFAIVVAAAFALFVVAGRGGPGMALSIAGCLLVGYFVLLWLLWWLWAQRAALGRVRCVALIVSVLALVAAGAHDLLMLYRVVVPSSHPYALFWGFAVLLLSCVAMSSSYLLKSLSHAEGANEQLAVTILSKTAQLEASYALLGARDRETARTQAREHLLREMHDGIGAQLITALRGVERGALGLKQVAQSLQDSLDELRMLMDSTEPNTHLAVVLAAWRNRWEAKLATAGVTLSWQIDDSLDTVSLSGDASLQIIRILQEAAANVVKHSQATHMVLNAAVKTSEAKRVVHIVISDDGIGFTPGAARVGARGLKNMQLRASEIGAQLTLASRGATLVGCQVLLEVPA